MKSLNLIAASAMIVVLSGGCKTDHSDSEVLGGEPEENSQSLSKGGVVTQFQQIRLNQMFGDGKNYKQVVVEDGITYFLDVGYLGGPGTQVKIKQSRIYFYIAHQDVKENEGKLTSSRLTLRGTEVFFRNNDKLGDIDANGSFIEARRFMTRSYGTKDGFRDDENCTKETVDNPCFVIYTLDTQNMPKPIPRPIGGASNNGAQAPE